MPDPTPDPTVLPDARACEKAAFEAWFASAPATCSGPAYAFAAGAAFAKEATQPASDAPASGAGEAEQARETIRDALMDSQYMAGVTAGWNASQADDPEAALASLRKSREGHMAGFAEAKAALAAAPKPASDAGAGLREALEEARRQLEYLDGRWPTGTTPAIIARIDATLTHPAPSGATGGGEVQATFACPICGEDKPHHHTPAVVDAYQNKRSRT